MGRWKVLFADAPRERCPSCSAPIVGTSPTLLLPLNACNRHSLSSGRDLSIGMRESTGKDALVDIVLTFETENRWPK